MTSTDNTLALFNRLQNGESAAADAVFHRYVGRLICLARGRLTSKLNARIDPEDVVQSAYRSFFQRVGQGQYALARSGDLWRLLAAVTINKLQHEIQRHTAGKRSINREQAPNDSVAAVFDEAVGREPTAIEVLTVVEELECLLRAVDGPARRMIEMRLQEYTIEEIAAELSCSERTVRRQLEKAKQHLTLRFADATGQPAAGMGPARLIAHDPG